MCPPFTGCAGSCLRRASPRCLPWPVPVSGGQGPLRSELLALCTQKPHEAQGPAAGHRQRVAELEGSSPPHLLSVSVLPTRTWTTRRLGPCRQPQSTQGHRTAFEGWGTVQAVGPCATGGKMGAQAAMTQAAQVRVPRNCRVASAGPAGLCPGSP